MKTVVAAAVTIIALSAGILPVMVSHAMAIGNGEATRMQQNGAYSR